VKGRRNMYGSYQSFPWGYFTGIIENRSCENRMAKMRYFRVAGILFTDVRGAASNPAYYGYSKLWI
jgi:hypothetical protein